MSRVAHRPCGGFQPKIDRTGRPIEPDFAGELTVLAFYKIWKDGPASVMVAVTSLTTAGAVTLAILALERLTGDYVQVGEMPSLFVYVLVISIGMTLLGYTLSRAFNVAGPDSAHQVNDTSAAQAFLERLPVKFQTAELWAVASEDHYCRVFTSLGTELVLLRLSDADRDLASVDGLRVHRSWWVARRGVAEARRAAGRYRLVLKSVQFTACPAPQFSPNGNPITCKSVSCMNTS